MIRKKNFLAFFLSVLIISGGFFETSAENCDRECLENFITRYLNAMVAHQLDSLPLAGNARFTEDCKETEIGEGLWKTVTALRKYRLDILDIRTQNAFTFTVVEEGNKPVLFALRLKIANQKITEIETMVVKSQQDGMIFKPEALQSPSASMTMIPEADQLNSRQEAIDIAVHYPEGLKIGSFVKVDAQFGPDAYRFENGQLMAGEGCTFFSGCDKIKTQTLPTLSGIKYKVALVDEEAGIVLLRMNFGRGSVMGDNNKDLDVFEAFKIYDGQINAVEAFMQVVPAGTTFGWDYDQTSVRNRLPATTGSGKVIPTDKGVLITNPYHAETVTYKLFNINGRLIDTRTVRFNSRTVLLPPDILPPGYYFCRVQYHSESRSINSSLFTLNITR